MTATLKPDPVEIARTLRLLLEPGQVTELRALNVSTPTYRQPHTTSGYFDQEHITEMARVAAQVSPLAKVVYFTPNPVNPALIARASNRARACGKGDHTTSDRDIRRRRGLLVDVDYVRPAGISSSHEEHEAALALARTIRDALTDENWPAPILADSGNGAHLLYRIELPTDDGGLVKRCLEALAHRFDVGTVKVDTSVFNPARLWKLYGTIARKGDSTADRPHRMARLLEVPDALEVVPRDLLEGLAAKAPKPDAKPARVSETAASSAPSWSVEAWIQKHRTALDRFGLNEPEPWQGGRRWIFKVCPWTGEEHASTAGIFEQADGQAGASCRGERCHGKNWHALRDVIEPGWRNEKKSQAGDEKRTGPADETDQEPIPPEPEVMAFPLTVFPDRLADFVKLVAKAILCPVDYVAVPLLVAAGVAIGTRRVLQVKPGWEEGPRIYAAIIAKPSAAKSPALNEILRPLYFVQKQMDQENQQQERQYQEECARRAKAKGKDRTTDLGAQPLRRQQIITTDCTTEALAQVLCENPGGVLFHADELTGWVRSMNQYKSGKGSDRQAAQAADWIKANGGQATGRDLLRAGVAGVKRNADARKLLSEMVERGLGRVERRKASNGKEMTFFVLSDKKNSVG